MDFLENYQKIGARFSLFDSWSLQTDYIKLILKQSSPLMVQYMISIVSWEFFYILIEHKVIDDRHLIQIDDFHIYQLIEFENIRLRSVEVNF